MTKSRFKSSGKTNRAIAFSFTMLFHISLIGGLYYSSNSENPIKDLLPDFVKEWFDSGKEQTNDKTKDRA